jgi:hypothetical protein
MASALMPSRIRINATRFAYPNLPGNPDSTQPKSALGSIIAIGVSIPAHAADMAVKAPPPPVPVVAPYNWSGLYVGGNFGGAWTSGSLNIAGNNFYGGLTEFIGGVQVGYNFQAGDFLYGVEGTFDWATFDHPTLPFPTLGSVSQHWIGTAAARVGVDKRQALRALAVTYPDTLRAVSARSRSPAGASFCNMQAFNASSKT